MSHWMSNWSKNALSSNHEVQVGSWVCQIVLLLVYSSHTHTQLVGSVQGQQPIAAGDLHPTSCVLFYLAGIGWHVKFLLRECSQSEIKVGSKRRTRSFTGDYCLRHFRGESSFRSALIGFLFAFVWANWKKLMVNLKHDVKCHYWI